MSAQGAAVMNARVRSWCFTHNNYSADDEERYQTVIAEHVVYGREVGEQGTPHLQGFVRFRNPRLGRSVSRLLPGSHLTVARNLEASIRYCRKDGDVYERGATVFPGDQRANAAGDGGQGQVNRWRDTYIAAQEGRFEDIPYDIRFKHDITIQRLRLKRLSDECPRSIPILDNDWLWGPSGTGKSTTAREENPDAYEKMRNKWWDEYKYEEVVILDDVDPRMEDWITSFLKDWADHHRIRVEIKNSSAVIRPRRLIVTSQYSIDQCFKDPETRSALHRRFHERYIAFIGPQFDPGYDRRFADAAVWHE